MDTETFRKYDVIIQKQIRTLAPCSPTPASVASSEHNTVEEPSNLTRSAASPPTSTKDAISIGNVATFVGLSSSADLNGRVCNIHGFDKSTERFIVRVLGCEQSLKVQSRNLSVLFACPSCGGDISTNQCYACSYFSDMRAPELPESAPFFIHPSSGKSAYPDVHNQSHTPLTTTVSSGTPNRGLSSPVEVGMEVA